MSYYRANWMLRNLIAVGLWMLAITVWASPAEFRKAVVSAKNPLVVEEAWENEEDRNFILALNSAVADVTRGSKEEFPEGKKRLLAAIDAYTAVRARLQGAKEPTPENPAFKKELQKVHQSSTESEEEKSSKESNWLARAFEKIKKAPASKPEPKNPGLEPGVNVNWLSGVITILLYAAVGAALALAIWATRGIWQRDRKGKGKAGALLDEDEPNRRADEWLEQAEALAAQGKYREACRSLYLAMLVRLDEARIMRFDRSETNWEHLNRLQGIPTRPAGVEIGAATKKIDLVWYGHRCEGLSDVDWFKSEYTRNLRAIEGKGTS